MNQVIHQVGPVYGVRDYLSSVRKAWEGDLDDIISLERAQHALKSSKDPQVVADELPHGGAEGSGLFLALFDAHGAQVLKIEL